MTKPWQRLLIDEFCVIGHEPIRVYAPDSRRPDGGFAYGCGHLYFISADATNQVKIGFTAGSPEWRINELQCGCPYRLRLLAAMEGPRIWEAALHRDFARHRRLGEWFEFVDEIKCYLRYLKSISGQPLQIRRAV